MGKLFRHLDAHRGRGTGELRHPAGDPPAIRVRGRRSEIVTLQWDWVDLDNRRVVWPDSKTGGMSKPLSEEAYRLLSTAPRQDGCPYVLPSPNHPGQAPDHGRVLRRLERILKARVPHVGTHGIRHRSATDIANSGIPVKVGMALTAHKTVAMFMRYVHTEDKPVREAAELVANRRKTITGAPSPKEVSGMNRASNPPFRPNCRDTAHDNLPRSPPRLGIVLRDWKSMPVSGIVWRSG
jgi:integrase